MELKAGCCGKTPTASCRLRCRRRRRRRGRRCYCWNIGLPIFSSARRTSPFASRRGLHVVLTAPFICRMQIECNRRAAPCARHCLGVAASTWSGLQAKQRETTVTQAQLHVRIRSIAVLPPRRREKKSNARGSARDAAQARKFFIRRRTKKERVNGARCVYLCVTVKLFCWRFRIHGESIAPTGIPRRSISPFIVRARFFCDARIYFP